MACRPGGVPQQLRWRRPVRIAGLAGLVAYLVVFLLARYFAWPPRPTGDAAIVFDMAREVFAHADYPARLALANINAVFPYPPSAVLMFRALAAGPALFAAAWLALTVAGFFLMFAMSVAHERAALKALWPLLAGGALLAAGSPVEWDLRNANCNLIYVGLIVAGFGLIDRNPRLAGTLVALAVSLKLYAALLIVWLFAQGARRAGWACVATMIALWLILPIAIFGLDGTMQVYLGWFEQLRIIADPPLHARASGTGPPLVSLMAAATALTGEAPDSVAARALVLLLGCAWSGALVWYATRALARFAVDARSRAALADWTVLLLAPLPFSPWLEPYHAVPLVLGAMLCLTIAADAQAPMRSRLVAAAAVAALALVRLAGVPFALRGFGLLAQFLALVIALGLLRPSLALPASGSAGPAAAPR